ncbi:hypothetical protein B0T25DRAFT_539324 [Lasiosphaeria hispida]|uniref:Secreted protein n=1 Tax=Lasiosphaeria hispida TaxID=260671 RepID=A0AAJ0HMU2_9PEZI|nr:hypothetical protein B0T25DRAFT_539324 [Lasiosphaeria hispida]
MPTHPAGFQASRWGGLSVLSSVLPVLPGAAALLGKLDTCRQGVWPFDSSVVHMAVPGTRAPVSQWRCCWPLKSGTAARWLARGWVLAVAWFAAHHRPHVSPFLTCRSKARKQQRGSSRHSNARGRQAGRRPVPTTARERAQASRSRH